MLFVHFWICNCVYPTKRRLKPWNQVENETRYQVKLELGNAQY